MPKLSVPVFLFFIGFSMLSYSSFAWDKKGHDIVARIAFHYLGREDSSRVMAYLGGMKLDEAANWMDEMRNNPQFSYTAPWHYINLPKGSLYIPSDKDDIVNALNTTLDDLKTNQNIKGDQVSIDLLILMHLVADIHQPFHTGYTEDNGGKNYMVSYQGKSSNLYKVWDGEIIESQKINYEKCQQVADSMKDVEIGNVIDWLNASRALVAGCYPDSHTITETYIKEKVPVIEQQLALAGIRLAAVLYDVLSYVKVSPVVK